MNKKDYTTKQDLLSITDLLESMQIRYWLVGGWGIDVLIGLQNREHKDIDINFDENSTEELLEKLLSVGYVIETDLRPLRIELFSSKYGFLDIHPFVINADGSAKKSDMNGGWWNFDSDYFGTAELEGKLIPCLSVKGQKAFHSGYELREKDKVDMKLLQEFEEKEVYQINIIEE